MASYSKKTSDRANGEIPSNDSIAALRAPPVSLDQAGYGMEFYRFIHKVQTHEIAFNWKSLASLAKTTKFWIDFLRSNRPEVHLFIQQTLKEDGSLEPRSMEQGQLQCLSEAISMIFPTLDSIDKHHRLSKMFAIVRNVERDIGYGMKQYPMTNTSPAPLATHLVQLGILSPEAPPGHHHSRGRGHPSFYLRTDVVGENWAAQNRITILKGIFKTLDHANKDTVTTGIASLLELPWPPTMPEVAKTLLKQGIVTPEIPAFHRLPASRISFYFDRELITDRQVWRSNLQKYFSESYNNLGEVQNCAMLASALRVPPGSRSVAKALIDEGIVSAQIPPRTELFRRGLSVNHYIDQRVMGVELAKENLITWLKEQPAVKEWPNGRLQAVKKQISNLFGEQITTPIKDAISAVGITL